MYCVMCMRVFLCTTVRFCLLMLRVKKLTAIFQGAKTKLEPVTAFQSSRPLNPINRKQRGPEKCIDGIIDNPKNFWDQNFSLCATNTEKAPWLAIDYGKDAKVSVAEVVLYNREDCCHRRTRNVEIWLADEIPTSGAEKFSGGNLIGTFAGPGTSGERIVIQSQQGWEKKSGRYLIVQNSNGNKDMLLNLREVIASGSSCPGAE